MPLPHPRETHERRQEEPGDEWLISYADLITLLFAFFALLLSMSSINLVKFEQVAEQFSETPRMTMKQLTQTIEESIRRENLQDQVTVGLTSNGVEVSFKDKLLFDVGKADLRPAAVPALEKISIMLKYPGIVDRKVMVEGHTDSLPILGGIFPSNWELSSARAASVVRFFIGQGMPRGKFEAIGYADTRPKAADTDPLLGQAENRRVVVVISPEGYLKSAERKEIAAGAAQTVPSGNKTP